jgi:hypothetical protein
VKKLLSFGMDLRPKIETKVENARFNPYQIEMKFFGFELFFIEESRSNVVLACSDNMNTIIIQISLVYIIWPFGVTS